LFSNWLYIDLTGHGTQCMCKAWSLHRPQGEQRKHVLNFTLKSNA
jgi:hypothetical protein